MFANYAYTGYGRGGHGCWGLAIPGHSGNATLPGNDTLGIPISASPWAIRQVL